MNFELKVKEILKETYILTGKIDDKDIINNLLYFVKNNINEKLNHQTNIKGSFTGFESLTTNINFISFLKKIRENIKVVYQKDFIIYNAWGTLCKIGEEVLEHAHPGVTGFCGILYLTEEGPGTYFKEHDFLIKEEIGKYVLFHPSLLHSVSKITDKIERITVAFNMNEVKPWQDLSNVVKV